MTRIAGASCLLVALAAGGPAEAEVFVGPKGATVRPEHVQTVVRYHDGETTLLQTVHVQSNASRFVWLKPFPVAPDVQLKPAVTLSNLDRQTTVKAPHNHTVREDLFGPSVATWALRSLTRDPKPAAQQPVPTRGESRILDVVDYKVFDGRVQTSTITGNMILPEALRVWLDRQRVPISERLKSSIAGHINRDWVVLAVSVGDQAPSAQNPARLPVIQFRFASKKAVMPLMRVPVPYSEQPTFDIWTLADRRLISSVFPTTWDNRPWELQRPLPSRFTAVYSRAVHAREPLAETLSGELGLRLPPTPTVVRHRFQHSSEVWQELSFMTAIDAPDIPSTGQRGGLLDVFLCLMLGLTPLLFAPESWLLLWARRREAADWVAYLWPSYAVIVAIYWFVRLDGVGRLAGLIPLALGAYHVLKPSDGSHDDDFVRVQFKRKAKA